MRARSREALLLDTGGIEANLRRMPRYRRCRFVAGLALLLEALVAAPPLAEMSMAQECPLTAPLAVKDLQSGVVGQTGTVWTVGTDCSFAVARQVATNIAAPHRQGRLAAEQQNQLRDVLARTDPASLPREIGTPQVNGRQILLTYGRTQSALNLSPGGGNLDSLRARSHEPAAARLLELAEAVRDMTGS